MVKLRNLRGHWVHSWEEDDGNKLVFRPAGTKLPLARGRDAFELQNKNVLVDHPIAPGDGNLHQTGRWELDESGDVLHLYASSQQKAPRAMKIVSSEPNRLVLEELA